MGQIKDFPITDQIIDAVALYKDALRENQAELEIPLTDCEICYVPNMPHSHRTIWSQSDLFVFYRCSDGKWNSDFLKVSNSKSGARRGVYFTVLDCPQDIQDVIHNIACDNLQLPHSAILLNPQYIEIDPIVFSRLLNLLAFG